MLQQLEDPHFALKVDLAVGKVAEIPHVSPGLHLALEKKMKRLKLLIEPPVLGFF
jgi:hypothetical protein